MKAPASQHSIWIQYYTNLPVASQTTCNTSTCPNQKKKKNDCLSVHGQNQVAHHL